MKAARQASLFDAETPADDRGAEAARGRMRGMIERLRGTTVPVWRDQMAVILDDGAFKRAMGAVPAAEGEALWAEYDAEMERVYAIWAAGREGSVE